MKFLRFCFAASLASLLVACAPASKINILPPIDDSVRTLAPDEGVLILRVADASPRLFWPLNFITLAPRDVYESDGNKFPRIEAVSEPTRTSSTYIAILPANEYSVESLRSYYHFGDRWYSEFYSAEVNLGTFQIQPGRLTNLGTIALTIDTRGDDFIYRIIRTAALNSPKSIVEQHFPNIASSLPGDEVLGWQDDGMDEDRFAEYARAVQNPVISTQPWRDDYSGTITFPARLGVLVHHHPSGEWGLEKIEEDADILSFTRSPASSEVIVGEHSVAKWRADAGQPWHDLHVPPGAGTLVYAAFDGDGVLHATMKRQKGLTLWRTSSPREPAWEHAGELSPDEIASSGLLFGPGFLDDPAQIQFHRFFATEDHLFILARNELFRYDYSSAELKHLELEGSLEALSITNEIIIYKTTSFMSTEYWFSLNGGHQFQELPFARPGRERGMLKFVSVPVYAGNNSFVALREPALSHQPPLLMLSRDNGENWEQSETTLPAKDCHLSNGAEAGELWLQCPLSGEFWRSSNLGASWEIDRERQRGAL